MYCFITHMIQEGSKEEIMLYLLLLSCLEEKIEEVVERPANFTVRPGIESVSVLDAQSSVPLTLYDPQGTPLVTLVSDSEGQAHFAYIPEEHQQLNPANFETVSLENGSVLQAGDGYYIQDDTSTNQNWSGRFRVLAIDDLPEEEMYNQSLEGIHYSPLTGHEGDTDEGFQYITMRDGASLSAMIRFPDPLLYGDGPYPTVIEYSGYSPSRPNRVPSGSAIANALGYATVSVNMRGTGCSGGVFDVFNRAQHADGYDLVEIVARQEWVLHNHVGMVGLSYPGISQLYVASTQPPSLAGIVPLSTIADAWQMQWPGGIYNKGFTRQWVEARESESQAGGSSWVGQRIENGDTQCAENLSLSHHSVDFETFLRGLPMRPPDADARDLNLLVSQITAPVFFGGVFQDEQTGGQFADMLDRFTQSESLKIIVSNGRHPDGFAPESIAMWFEFLEFYVARRIPVINPAVRIVAADEFGAVFGMSETDFPEDRFVDYPDFESALSAYEAEPIVTLFLERGAGGEETGAPIARFQEKFETWPPTQADELLWFLSGEESLSTDVGISGVHSYIHDREASDRNFFGSSGYSVLSLLWDLDWSYFDTGYLVSYRSQEFTEDTIVRGPGIIDLWVRSPESELQIQATLTEIRPDNTEVFIQSGWIRVGHQAEEGDNLRLQYTFHSDDFIPLELNTWTQTQISIPSFAHPIRTGSRLQIALSSPGRDHGTWQFEAPAYEEEPSFEIGYGLEFPSTMRLQTIPGILIPSDYPDCLALRGQPCRSYLYRPNTVVE
ncbi:MAG: hypothetical protein CL916_07050 [Deltaproteobacteria bacterium]|nr:hypothetical protein [Deltaproteobacteria bacterium]